MRWLLPIAGCLALALLLFGGRAVATRSSDFNERLDEAYSAMQVGYLISDHLHAEGEMPSGWEDLEPQFATRFESWDFSEYIARVQQHVDIAWGLSIDSLAEADSSSSPPFPVVTCKSGKMAGPTERHEANLIIFEEVRRIVSSAT